MAQAIHCDGPGETHLADVLVSRIDNGDTTAWCFAHYVDVCRAVVESAEQASRERGAGRAASRPDRRRPGGVPGRPPGPESVASGPRGPPASEAEPRSSPARGGPGRAARADPGARGRRR